MSIKKIPLIAVLCATLPVSGCALSNASLFSSSNNVEAAHLVGPVVWHAGNERRCLASGYVRETPFIRARSSLGRPSGCGAERPYVVAAALSGSVALSPPATLRCPMIGPVEYWLYEVVQPAARRYLGQDVANIRVISSYSCRSRNGKRGAKLSEHGRANAIDISAFRMADGSTITVKANWRVSDARSAFLRAIHRGACRYFTTVLGPNADRYHQDHFHFDLARHGRTGSGRVCK